MADGGASSFILLVTALLVSGSVSVLLINQWGQMAQSSTVNVAALEAERATGVAFAGDPMMVDLDTTNQEITFYLQNIGENLLDPSTLVVIVDGESVTSSIVDTLVPAGNDWDSTRLLEVTVDSTSWSYASGDDVALTVAVFFEVVNGYCGLTSISLEVRLHD
jgi:archaellum component FlaG (FlaF/FlaG flagellin family)